MRADSRSRAIFDGQDETGMTRPICAYPGRARCDGSGDPSRADSIEGGPGNSPGER